MLAAGCAGTVMSDTWVRTEKITDEAQLTTVIVVRETRHGGYFLSPETLERLLTEAGYVKEDPA